MKSKVVVSLVLFVYVIIIFLPPIMYGYIYPNNGDDSAVHLEYFDLLSEGKDIGYTYLGRQIVGYPMIAFNKLFGWSIDSQFLWFNYLVLWLVGVAVFIMVSKITNWQSGLLSIPIIMFASPIVLNLFDTGGIFDLINIGIMLPLGVLGLTYVLVKKWKWIIPTLIIVGLAVAIHLLVVISMNPINKQPLTPIIEFFGVFLGRFVILILFVTSIYLVARGIKLNREEKISKWILILLAVFMGIFAFTQLSAWATRAATELAIILTILCALLVGIVLKRIESKKIAIAIAIILTLFSIPVLSQYYHYNSAVKSVDLEAIKYVNSLSGKYYSCSNGINPLIYARFINKEYQRDSLPYIKRSQPMTSGSTKGTQEYIWGDGKNEVPANAKGIIQSFLGNGIEIDVIQ